LPLFCGMTAHHVHIAGNFVNSLVVARPSRTADAVPAVLPPDRASFSYSWPHPGALSSPAWQFNRSVGRLVRPMPESREELAADSRWPAFFPSSICLATVCHQGVARLEKVVGATIVNRFPYVLALSLCRQPPSPRHYVHRAFMDALEASGRAGSVHHAR
jgi:hypothetical protein